MNIQDLERISIQLHSALAMFTEREERWTYRKADRHFTTAQCISIGTTYRICRSEIEDSIHNLDGLIARMRQELRAAETALVTIRNWARPESELTPGIVPGVSQMDDDTQRDFERWVDAT